MHFSLFTTTIASNKILHLCRYHSLSSSLHKFQPILLKYASVHEQTDLKLPSYLCIPPSHSSNNVSILIPYFDFDFSESGRRSLKSNLKRRKMSASFDVDQIASNWLKRKELKEEVTEAEGSFHKIRQEMRLKDVPQDSSDLFEPLKRRLQMAKKSLRDLEETLMQELLLLPNDIHELTPIVGAEATPESSSAEFIELGPYLRGRHALAELAVLDFFADRFSGSDFVPFSGPDVCKPIVIEGCGHDFHDPEETFHLKGDSERGRTEYHLTGSASLPSFCACLAKCSLNRSLLPLKYFATGRAYLPPKSGRNDPVQSSRLHFFAAASTGSEEDRTFSSLLDVLVGAYDDLGLSASVVDVPADRLSPAESRRADLRLRSPSTLRTVASVASCGDFVSKRLWMCHHDGTENGFLHVVHGTGVSVPQLLAHLVESRRNADGTVDFPPPLQAYMTNY